MRHNRSSAFIRTPFFCQKTQTRRKKSKDVSPLERRKIVRIRRQHGNVTIHAPKYYKGVQRHRGVPQCNRIIYRNGRGNEEQQSRKGRKPKEKHHRAQKVKPPTHRSPRPRVLHPTERKALSKSRKVYTKVFSPIQIFRFPGNLHKYLDKIFFNRSWFVILGKLRTDISSSRIILAKANPLGYNASESEHSRKPPFVHIVRCQIFIGLSSSKVRIAVM